MVNNMDKVEYTVHLIYSFNEMTDGYMEYIGFE